VSPRDLPWRSTRFCPNIEQEPPVSWNRRP
jgi:hypothetical protein